MDGWIRSQKSQDIIGGLNLVLLGKIGAGKSASGNTILGRKAFESKESFTSVTQDLAIESGTVCGRRVTVYDTPGLFNTKLSEEEVLQIYANVLQRCESRPCVFLLVIKADRFTEKERETVEKIEELLGENRLKKTLILFTGRDELEEENMSIDEFINETEPLKRLVQKYDQRYHVFNNKKKEPNGQVPELLSKIDAIEKGAKPKQIQVKIRRKAISSPSVGESAAGNTILRQGYLKPLASMISVTSDWPEFDTIPSRPTTLHPGRLTRWIPFRLHAPDESDISRWIVLLGKTGDGKSAAGNTILGQKEFRSVRSTSSVTRECSDAHATVSGRSVSVVDTPGFIHTQMKPEELMTEIARSVHLSNPGPHAFLIVINLSIRFTEHELQMIEQIKTLFGEGVLKYSIILFTHGDLLEEQTVETIIEENSALRDLVDQCGGRFHIFNNKDQRNREQVNDLLQKIDTMIEQNGGGHYSNQMFEDANRFRRVEKQRQEEIERVRKETEEKIRAECEGPPRFLLERLKQMRQKEEDRIYRSQILQKTSIFMVMEVLRKRHEEKQRQEEIERVIKETEERIRAEFECLPWFFLERCERKRMEKQRQRAEFEDSTKFLPERFRSMRLTEKWEKTQEEIERVRKETEEKIRAEFEGPPRFLLERLKQMRQREEDIIRRVVELHEELEGFFPFRHIYMDMYIVMRSKREEEIEKVIKETGEKIRAEFEGPPR